MEETTTTTTTPLGVLGREFALAAGAVERADVHVPRAMDKRSVEFVVDMILDELEELLATVHGTEAGAALARMARARARRAIDVPVTSTDLIAEQLDALVDICYYVSDASARAGLPLDDAIMHVHAANMAKRDPRTGKFTRNPSGKILKPPGWQPPDLRRLLPPSPPPPS